jgi:hypothetical protein
MITAMGASALLVLVTILIHYEVLRFTSERLADLPLPPRPRIVVVVLAAFAAHTVEVWLYGGAYWLLTLQLGVGSFGGDPPAAGFEDCLYLSVVTYTSLGLGDLYPVSHARLLAGVEALNGLLLIGWSASFTYLAMQRYWPLHKSRRRQGTADDAAEAPARPGRERSARRRAFASRRDALRPALSFGHGDAQRRHQVHGAGIGNVAQRRRSAGRSSASPAPPSTAISRRARRSGIRR